MQQPFVFTGSTDQEKSLVCPADIIPENIIVRDDGWRAFRICGVLDFSLIGILSKLSGILAENGIALFAVSTYNTDYILVKEYDFKKGDTIVFNMDSKSGKIHVNVAEKEKESIFSCDFYDSFDEEVEIQNDGHFFIEVSGRRARGDMEVVINKVIDNQRSIMYNRDR